MKVFFCSWFIFSTAYSWGQTDLQFYLEKAAVNSPYLQEFVYQHNIANLEVDKIGAQFKKPQWTVTGDYLLAPYFFNNGRVVSISEIPDSKAIGYDAGISNGGLYSGLANVNYPLFTRRQMQPLVQQQQLAQFGFKNQSQLHLVDLKRRITADYINAYLLLQAKGYIEQVRNRINQERDLVHKLVDRGLMRVTDLELLSLEINNQDYQINTLNIQYRQALQVLNTDAGIVDTTLVNLADVELELESEQLASIFLEQYRFDSLMAVNDQAIFETRYLPQVNVFANGGINAVILNNIYRKIGFSAGIHLSVLFEDGDQRGINGQQNEIKKLNASNKLAFARNQIENSRQGYKLVLEESRNNITQIDTQLEGYDKLLATYRQEMALGQISVIEYLNVLRTYLGLQQQKIQLQIQLLLIINELNYWSN